MIEATSGNTGIGLAMVAAVLKYRLLITLPDRMSEEKVNTLRALGAETIWVSSEFKFDHCESYIGVAEKLNKSIPRSIFFDQYSNPSNPIAHYDGTAAEIWDQTD